MAGKIFDWDEPHPSVVIEMVRQKVLETIAGLIDTADQNTALSDLVDWLVLDDLDAAIRNDSQDEAIDLLILDSLGGL